MSIVYMLRHELETEDLLTYANVIGIFSSEEKAQEAIAQLEQDDEFKEYPRQLRDHPPDFGWHCMGNGLHYTSINMTA